jgi:hypothetical protein
VEVVEARNLVPKDGHGTSSWTSMAADEDKNIRTQSQPDMERGAGVQRWESVVGVRRHA